MSVNFFESDPVFLNALCTASESRLITDNSTSGHFRILDEETHWIVRGLVCRAWNQFAQGRHPLTFTRDAQLKYAHSILMEKEKDAFSKAIRCNSTEKVIALLDKGCNPCYVVKGTRQISIVEYTPYLCALDHGANEVAEILRVLDGNFTEKFIHTRLISLRFDLGRTFYVNGARFSGEGLDHYTHHNYLIPDMHRSILECFKTHPVIELEGMVWDSECTEQLLEALKGSLCTACPSAEEAFKRKVFIISDSSLYGDQHWISCAYSVSKMQVAIGNRGLGCGDFPGVNVYSLPSLLVAKQPNLLKQFSGCPAIAYFNMDIQKSGSCARKSPEAAIKSAIYFILSEKYASAPLEELMRTTDHIFAFWLKYDRIACVNEMLDLDPKLQFDYSLFSVVSRVFNECDETKKRLQAYWDQYM